MTTTPASPPITPKPKIKRTPLEIRRKVRAAFVMGKGSLVACADMFGVNPETAQDWSSAEDWTGLRSQFEQREFDKLLPATPEVPRIETPAGTTQAGKLASVETQLREIDELLKGCVNPDTIRKLWDAKNCALNAWALLTGFPKPGTRRQSRPGARPISAPVPMEPDLPKVETPPSQ